MTLSRRFPLYTVLGLLTLACAGSEPRDSNNATSETARPATEVVYEPAYPEEVSAEGLSEDDVGQQEAAHEHAGGDHTHGDDSHTHGEETHTHDEDDEDGHDHDG